MSNPYGEGVLRVSEIATSFKPSIEGLLRWSAMLGFGYQKDRQLACDIGNAVHKYAEAALAADPVMGAKAVEMFQALEPSEQRQATNANSAFTDWASHLEIDPVHLELKMNNFSGLFSEPLESDIPKIGGTCDFIGKINGEWVMVDWKSSKHLNRGYGIQLAGYKYLYELNYPDAPPLTAFKALRLDKEDGCPEEYDYTPWIQEAEWRFLTHAKLMSGWSTFTDLEY